MKNATRLDEIDDFLRDGGSIDDLLIEPEPSNRVRNWSKAGMEVDIERDTRNKWKFNRRTGRWEI